MMTGGTLQTEIDGLIRNLSICSGTAKCEDCQMMQEGCNFTRLAFRAIGAIGGLQQIAEHYEQSAKDYWKEACEYKAQLPKQGEWIEDEETYAGQGLSNYKCSLCGKICGTWKRGLNADKLPSYCGNCGARMKEEV